MENESKITPWDIFGNWMSDFQGTRTAQIKEEDSIEVPIGLLGSLYVAWLSWHIFNDNLTLVHIDNEVKSAFGSSLQEKYAGRMVKRSELICFVENQIEKIYSRNIQRGMHPTSMSPKLFVNLVRRLLLALPDSSRDQKIIETKELHPRISQSFSEAEALRKVQKMDRVLNQKDSRKKKSKV